MKWLLAYIFLAALSGIASAGTTYYVDAVNGNDTWRGTVSDPQGNPASDGPWRSLSNASALVTGDTLLLRCGEVWREQLTLTVSVTVGSYGTDCNATNKPEINGADVVTGWSLYSGNIYRAAITKPVKQVFVDGHYVPLAHYPSKDASGSSFLAAANGSGTKSYVTANAADAAYLNAVDGSGNLLRGISNAGIHIRTVPWLIEDDTVPAGGLSGSTISLSKATTQDISKGDGYYVDNKLWMLEETAIDQPGEWYWDQQSGVLYLRLSDGSDPGRAGRIIEASVRNYGIYIYASKYASININNVTVNEASQFGVYLDTPDDFDLAGLSIKNSGDSGVYSEGGSDRASPVIASCTVSGAWSRAIENSQITNSVRHAVYLNRTSQVRIHGNTILETDTVGSPVWGVGAVRAGSGSHNNEISNNTVTSSGYNGIAFGLNTLVQRNLVYDSCKVLSDCGAIYTFNGSTDTYYTNGAWTATPVPVVDSCIDQNIVNGVGVGVNLTGQVNPGIYLDNFSNAIEVSNNTVLNAGYGLHANNAFNNIIHDNTFYGASKAQMNMVSGYDAPPGVVQGYVGSGGPAYNQVKSNTFFSTNDAPALLLNNSPSVTGSTDPYFGVFGDSADSKTGGNIYSSLCRDTLVRDIYSNQSNVETYYQKTYALNDWQRTRSEDLNSVDARNMATLPPHAPLAPFQIDSVQQLMWASFDSSLDGYSTVDSSTVTPTSACPGSTSGGCINFVPNPTGTSSHLAGTGKTFPVESGAKYLVQFKLYSNLPQQNLVLRIIGIFVPYGVNGCLDPKGCLVPNGVNGCTNSGGCQDWHDVGFLAAEDMFITGDGQDLVAGPEWRDYYYVFTASETNTAMADFYVKVVPNHDSSTTPSILIDNVSVKKVTGNFNADQIGNTLIVVNDGTNPVTGCPDSTRHDQYTDLTGAPFDCTNGSLAPFTSKILVWKNAPTINPPTDIGIVVTRSPETALLGGTVSYTMTVTNNGSTPATGVTVIDQLGGATFASTGSSADCNGTDTVTCKIGNLAANASTPLTVNTTPKTTGTLTNTATVASVEFDPNPDNNTGTTNTTVNPAADLSMVFVPTPPSSVPQGGIVSYTLSVTNNGPSPATGVTVTGTLPTCTLGNLAAGAITTCPTSSVTATTVGSLPQTMTVSGNEADTVTGNNMANATTNVQAVLTVSRTGTGSGTVTSDPAGINCGTDCTEPYNANSRVTLTATQATGSTFSGWSGDCAGTASTCTVTMGNSKNVIATFNGLPDMIVSAVSGPTNGTTGSSVTISTTTANTGTVTSPASTTGLYVSTDATITSSDTRLGSRAVSSMNPSASSVGSTTVSLPAGLVTGSYFLGAIADDAGVITESDETNNAKTGNTIQINGVPKAPSTLIATVNSSSKITLTWTDNSTDESGFYVERSTNGTSFSQIAKVSANVKTYANFGLTHNTLYYYRVRAYNSRGNSAYSNTVSARTSP